VGLVFAGLLRQQNIFYYILAKWAKSAVKKFPQYFRLWCGDVEHGDGGDRGVYYE
jgi:hypothetical protein